MPRRDFTNKDFAMNHLTFRLGMRLAVPVIVLGALAMTGQPIHDVAHGACAHAILLTPCDASPTTVTHLHTVSGEESERCRRVALHLRWSLTLPAAPRLPGIGTPQ
jgi:hypothetical protein